jgi:hypothetical protein
MAAIKMNIPPIRDRMNAAVGFSSAIINYIIIVIYKLFVMKNR